MGKELQKKLNSGNNEIVQVILAHQQIGVGPGSKIMLCKLSDLATYINPTQGREKERKITGNYQINKVCLEIHVCSYCFFRLRVSFMNPCLGHDWMTTKQSDVSSGMMKTDTMLSIPTLVSEMMEGNKGYVSMLRVQVLESDHWDSNPCSAIDDICQRGLCKVTFPRLSSSHMRLDSNSSHLLRCGKNWIID